MQKPVNKEINYAKEYHEETKHSEISIQLSGLTGIINLCLLRYILGCRQYIAFKSNSDILLLLLKISYSLHDQYRTV
jgi:hypothetical protein